MATTSAGEMLQESHIVNHIFITVPHASSVFISNWGKKKEKTQTQNKQKPKQTTKVQLSILTNLSSEPIWITFEQPSMCNFIQTQKKKKKRQIPHRMFQTK